MKYPGQESSTLEFKREIPNNEQIIKTMIGFCNAHGGALIVGVENDGTIIGVPDDKVQTLLEFIEKSILEASYPPIIADVYAQRIGDKTLLLMEVAQGMNKPYYLKKDGKEKGVYLRLGRNTLRANDDMIEELKWDSRGLSFDVMPVYHASVDDLDKVKIKEFLTSRKSAIKGRPLSSKALQDAMHAYRITTKELDHCYPTTTGILLFGKQPQYFFPEARIMCNHFPGTQLGGKVIASKECLGTLDEQFEMAYNFMLSSLNQSWEMIGPRRVNRCEIPYQAVREIVMNAVIHRNYHMQSPGKIAIFDNRIEIFSPGVFPGPIAHNLQAGFTYLRNTAVCKIFREMGLIENFGTGIITTFASYEKEGLKAPEIIEGENFVKGILPRKVPQNMLTRSTTDDASTGAILGLFSTVEEVSVADLISVLYLTRSTATRKLSALVKRGFLKKSGKGRGVRYRLVRKG
ncbi:MAG: RNA-binding domain-containing protein [Candidatus Babeliales bacterium]